MSNPIKIWAGMERIDEARSGNVQDAHQEFSNLFKFRRQA